MYFATVTNPQQKHTLNEWKMAQSNRIKSYQMKSNSNVYNKKC